MCSIEAAITYKNGDIPEEAFNSVHPRALGRVEVNVKSRMSLVPCLDRWMFVLGVIVHDQVQLQALGCSPVDLFSGMLTTPDVGVEFEEVYFRGRTLAHLEPSAPEGASPGMALTYLIN